MLRSLTQFYIDESTVQSSNATSTAQKHKKYGIVLAKSRVPLRNSTNLSIVAITPVAYQRRELQIICTPSVESISRHGYHGPGAIPSKEMTCFFNDTDMLNWLRKYKAE